MSRLRFLTAIFFALLPALSATGEGLPFAQRVWTNKSGQKVTGTLVKAGENSAIVRLATGKDAELFYNLLSDPDVGYIQGERKLAELALAAAEKKAKSAPQPAAPAKGAKPPAKGSTGSASASSNSISGLVIDSILASKAYRLTVKVPGGKGTVPKVRGKIVAITSYRTPGSHEKFLMELEGGLVLAAAAYEAIWGAPPKAPLQCQAGEILQLPAPSDPAAKDKPSPPPVTGKKHLWGKGDTVEISGSLHFEADKIGPVSGFFTRGYSKLRLAASGKPPAKPAPAKK